MSRRLKSARAQVAAQQALIDEKIVKAPFAGRLGIRQVDFGQYLTAGTAVVTLQALDPILIDFYVPQQALEHMKIGQTATATVDTYPGVNFAGIVESINSKVDPASRNVQVRASFHNADRRLVPGMFANVRSTPAIRPIKSRCRKRPSPTTPMATRSIWWSTAVATKGQAKDTVQQRFVKLGATRGDQVAIQSGIKAGDVVVSAGQMKLRNGTAVIINNIGAAGNDPNPTPPNE